MGWLHGWLFWILGKYRKPNPDWFISKIIIGNSRNANMMLSVGEYFLIPQGRDINFGVTPVCSGVCLTGGISLHHKQCWRRYAGTWFINEQVRRDDALTFVTGCILLRVHEWPARLWNEVQCDCIRAVIRGEVYVQEGVLPRGVCMLAINPLDLRWKHGMNAYIHCTYACSHDFTVTYIHKWVCAVFTCCAECPLASPWDHLRLYVLHDLHNPERCP